MHSERSRNAWCNVRIGALEIPTLGSTLGEDLLAIARMDPRSVPSARVLQAFTESIRSSVKAPSWTVSVSNLQRSPQPDSYVAGAETQFHIKFSSTAPPMVRHSHGHDWTEGDWYIGHVDAHLPLGVVAWLSGTRQMSRNMIEANGSSLARAMRVIDSALVSKGVLWTRST